MQWFHESSVTSNDTLLPALLTSSTMKTPHPESPSTEASIVNWRDSRKHWRGPWCPWTSSWRRHPNRIFLWLVVQPKYRSSNRKLTIVVEFIPLCSDKSIVIYILMSKICSLWWIKYTWLLKNYLKNQWHTQGFCLGGGSTNSVEDRENGDLGAVAP